MTQDHLNSGGSTPKRSRSSTTIETSSLSKNRNKTKRSTLVFSNNRESLRNENKKESTNDKSMSFCGTVSMKSKKKKLAIRKFKKKFLVLVNESIEVYANDQEMIPDVSLNLSECLNVYVHPKKATHFKLVFKNGKYRFKTEKAAQAQHWVNYIQKNLEAMQWKENMSKLKLIGDQKLSDILGHYWKPAEQIKMEILRSKQFSNLVQKRDSQSTTSEATPNDTPATPKLMEKKNTPTTPNQHQDDEEDELSENYDPVKTTEENFEIPLYRKTNFDHKLHFMVEYNSFSNIQTLEFLTKGEVFHFLHKVLRDIGNVPNLHRVVIRQTPEYEGNENNSAATLDTNDTNDDEPSQTCIETDGVLYFNVNIDLSYVTQKQLTQLLQSFDMKRTISQLEANEKYMQVMSNLKSNFNIDPQRDFPIDFIMSAASINEFNDEDIISLLQNFNSMLSDIKSSSVYNYGYDVMKYLSIIFSSLHIVGTKRIRINHGQNQEIISGKVSDLKKFLPNRVYEVASDYFSSKIANSVKNLKIDIVSDLQELAHLEYIASKVEKRYENIPQNIETIRIQFRDEATATCIDKKVLIDCVANRNEKPQVSPSNPRRSRTRTIIRSPGEASSPASRNVHQPKRSRSRTIFSSQLLSPKHPSIPVYATPAPITFVLNSSKLSDYLESYTLTQRIRTPLQSYFKKNDWSLEETDMVKVIKTAISKLRNLWKDIDENLPIAERIISLMTSYSNLVNISLSKSTSHTIRSEIGDASDFQSIAFVLLRELMPIALAKSADMNRDVVIYGIPKVGKTTLLHKLKYGGDHKTMPSVGVVSETVHYHGLNITLHDVPQNHLKHFIRRMASSKISGIIYVMDSQNNDSISHLQKLIKKCAKRYKTEATPPSVSSPTSPGVNITPSTENSETHDGPTISIDKDNSVNLEEESSAALPVLVFANKQDLQAYDPKELIEQAIKKRKVLLHVENSVFIEDKGIKEGLNWLSQHIN
mmetsp:Transcript_8495/g.12534  ORF Transcript_8495/g.12534 Transcript_8495/m.12534 type:complete len:985 (+) Transcript_8495:56-3010(+)